MQDGVSLPILSESVSVASSCVAVLKPAPQVEAPTQVSVLFFTGRQVVFPSAVCAVAWV